MTRRPMPASPLDRIRRHLVGLKMPRALEVLDAHAARSSSAARSTRIEAIDALLAEELTLRENRRIKMALQMARLLHHQDARRLRLLASSPRSTATASWRWPSSSSSTAHEVRPLPRAARHRQEPSGHRPRRRGRAGRHAASTSPRSPIWSTALAKAEREGTPARAIRFLCRSQLLIVDEIGYLPVIPGGGNLFFQLVNARYESGAMILTSNRGFAEWGEVFGDPVVATALLDRLLHHAVVIQIEGSSYRLRAARRSRPRAHPLQGPSIHPPPASQTPRSATQREPPITSNG